MKKLIFKRLEKLAKKDANNFTTKFGLTIRRVFHKPISLTFKIILRIIYEQKIIIDKKVKLDKDKTYVFAANHSFYFDGAAIIATADRNFYSLFGATEQLHVEIRTLFIWIYGLIYVNRFDKKSRKDSILKMNKVLEAGNSILIFPEGRWNDSENLLCQKLFAGPYNLSVQNKIEVVPVSVYNDEKNHIYVSYGEPLKLYEYDTKDKGIEGFRVRKDSQECHSAPHCFSWKTMQEFPCSSGDRLPHPVSSIGGHNAGEATANHFSTREEARLPPLAQPVGPPHPFL